MGKRNRLIPLIVIEILILVVVCVAGIMHRRGMSEVPVDLALFQANDAFHYEDGIWVITEEQLDNRGFLIGADAEDSNIIHMTSAKMNLPKGDYTLSIQYDNSVDQDVELLCGKKYWRLLQAELFHLSKNQPVTTYHIRALDDIPDFQIQVKYNNYGTVRIYQMSLVPNANGIKRGILAVVLMSLLVNYVFCRREWIRSHRTRLMILIAVAFMLSVPLFAYGISGGHDTMFHLMRIEGIAEGLRNHQFPVRMSPVWLDGYGYPVSIYYGDILLYIPAVFRLFGYSVITSYKVFIICVNIATVWIAYRCFRGIFKDYKIAVVTAVAYAIAPYRFSCIYQRHAVGEYCAMIFFPVIALAMYRIYTGHRENRSRYNVDAVLLACGMTGLLFTHILSTEMAVVILAIVALVFAKRTFTWPVMRTILHAIGLACLMSACFVVPFLDYYMNVKAQINSDVMNGGFDLIQWRGAYIADLFNVFSNPFGWDDEFLYNRLAMTPGLMLMVAFVLAIGFICKGRASRELKTYTVASAILLWITTNLFPWDFLALHVWSGVCSIQFSVRFLGPACVFLSLTLGSVLVQLKELPRGKELLDMEPEASEWIQMQGRVENRRNRASVTWFLVCGALSMMIYLQYYSEYDYVVNFYDTAELDNAAVTSFFLREDTLEQAVSKGLMDNDNIISYEKTMDEGKTKMFSVTAGEGGGTVELPIFNYKGWHVMDANGSEYEITDGTQDLISVSLPSNYSGELVAYFESPWYWRVAEIISLITILGTMWAVHWKSKYGL